MALALPLCLCGCVHKTLDAGDAPVPPVPGQETVHVFVEWSNVRHAELFGSGTFALSNMYATRGGNRVKLPFAASLSGGKLSGEVLSYGHCPEGETCSHTLSLYVKTTDGKLLLKDVDVSAQMRVQRSSREVYLLIADEVDLSTAVPEPPVPGEDGAVHIFVRCLNVKDLDQIGQATFALSNLYGSKDKEKMTLPFTASVVDGMLAGDILCYGHCSGGEACSHTLSLLITCVDGSQRIVDFDVSEQMEHQRDAAVVFLLITDVIDPGKPDDPPQPGGDDKGVHIFVSCTHVRGAERISGGVFTLSNLFAEDGEQLTLPFPAYMQDATVAGHVYSYRHCPTDEPCQHTLTLLVEYTDGGQGVLQVDVSDQMEAQREQDKIYIVISDEVVPQTPIDFNADPEGGITPLQPGDTHDVS